MCMVVYLDLRNEVCAYLVLLAIITMIAHEVFGPLFQLNSMFRVLELFKSASLSSPDYRREFMMTTGNVVSLILPLYFIVHSM